MFLPQIRGIMKIFYTWYPKDTRVIYVSYTLLTQSQSMQTVGIFDKCETASPTEHIHNPSSDNSWVKYQNTNINWWSGFGELYINHIQTILAGVQEQNIKLWQILLPLNAKVSDVNKKLCLGTYIHNKMNPKIKKFDLFLSYI